MSDILNRALGHIGLGHLDLDVREHRQARHEARALEARRQRGKLARPGRWHRAARQRAAPRPLGRLDDAAQRLGAVGGRDRGADLGVHAGFHQGGARGGSTAGARGGSAVGGRSRREMRRRLRRRRRVLRVAARE